jgi:hypothetical protein
MSFNFVWLLVVQIPKVQDNGVILRRTEMINESKVLEVVKSVTNTPARFFNGTLFLETHDSAIAVDVFNEICEKVTAAVAFGKCGNDTSYDFLG